MNLPCSIIQLLSGAAAGNITGSAFPKLDLGTTANSILGMIGGILGGVSLLQFSAGDFNATDMQLFLCSVAGGAVGGCLLTALAGFVKNLVRRRR